MNIIVIAANFPEDPINVFRQGWQLLATYYAIAAIIVAIVWKLFKASRFLRSVKGRVIIAAVLALVFAPSEVSDFFLFNLPGPAVLGLAMLLMALPGLEPTSQSAPPVFLDWHFWVLIGGVYVLPILITSILAYAALSAYSRLRGPAVAKV